MSLITQQVYVSVCLYHTQMCVCLSHLQHVPDRLGVCGGVCVWNRRIGKV